MANDAILPARAARSRAICPVEPSAVAESGALRSERHRAPNLGWYVVDRGAGRDVEAGEGAAPATVGGWFGQGNGAKMNTFGVEDPDWWRGD